MSLKCSQKHGRVVMLRRNEKEKNQQQNKYSSVEFMLNELAIIVC